MCCSKCIEYWKDGWNKPFWNDGWILNVTRILFWFFQKLSIIRFIVFCKHRKYGVDYRKGYHAVDWYVFSWFLVEFILLILLANFYDLAHNIAFVILSRLLISYRLFDIFQAWVSQFVLGGVPPGWKPINIYRSLVLVFIGYIEIIISYALFAFVSNAHFDGITNWQQALYYSLRNAATIGTDWHPITFLGYTIFGTQIMFVLLFLTAVVNTIISHTVRR